MDVRRLRFLAFAGILLTLFLSTWYLMKTYHEGNPRWIFLLISGRGHRHPFTEPDPTQEIIY